MPRPKVLQQLWAGFLALVLLAALLVQAGTGTSPAAASTCAPTRTSFVGNGTIGDAGVTYRVLEFRQVGTCDWTVPDGVAAADVLIVAGGGGGGANVGGGGGAGGMVALTGAPLTAGQIVAVTVGAGGSGAFHTSGNATSGGASRFGASTANGGGHGASWSIQSAAWGGSGGGGSRSGYQGAAGTAGQGSSGGSALTDSQPHPAGGGGGAGASGGNGAGTQAGNGGAGRTSSITGVTRTYAGGGGGGFHGPGGGSAGSGGSGGGGNGGYNADGASGAANTGGGGGGTGLDATLPGTRGGAGGSGVVIVRVRSVATALDIGTEPVAGAPTGGALTTQPVVRILDGFGELVDDDVTEVSAAIVSGAGGTLGGTTTVTAVDGVATFTDLTITGDPTVDYVLGFSTSALTGATSQTVGVLPAVPTSLEIVTQPRGGARTGSRLPVQPVVRILDGFGVPIGDATTEVSVSIASGTGGVLGGTRTVRAVGGVATFTDLTLAGDPSVDHTLGFSASGLTGATSRAVRVIPGLATTCTPQPPRVGDVVTCTVTWGDPGSTILWEVASNPVIATGPVTLDARGTGTFGFTVPASALGSELTVELVEWTSPEPIGLVSGPAPTSVPTGAGPGLPSAVGGPAIVAAFVALATPLALVASLAPIGSRRRRVRADLRSR